MSIKKGNKVIAGAPLEPIWGAISGDIINQEDLQQALSEKISTTSPAFTGTPTAPTPPSGSDDDRIATTSFVQSAIQSSGGGLPDQTGQSGKFLTTNGTDASWANVPNNLPSQTGQSGKFLTTNGTDASWASVDAFPSQTGNAGKILTTNGTSVSWVETGSTSVIATGSTESRQLTDRFADGLNVKDFGAVGDGSTNDTTAVQAMITAVGYANFPKGTFVVHSAILDAPLYFEEGAALTVPSGKGLNITNTINSPKQYIFKGEGTYTLKNDTDSGEDARHVFASWFGIFPNINVDQSSKIQKMIDSVGNTRESVLEFDIGSYSLDSTVLIGRACWIRGQGIRRTVFRPLSDGWNVFETNNVGVRISDVQFENPSVDTIRTYPFIVINHTNCQVLDIAALCNFKNLITINANFTRIDGVMYGISKVIGTGSSVIKVKSSFNIIKNLHASYQTGSYYPESIVYLGDNSSELNGNIIDGIYNYNEAICVFIEPYGDTIRRTSISNIMSYGTGCDSIIKILAKDALNITDIDILNVHSYQSVVNGIYIKNSGTGIVQDITLDGLNFDGGATNGIYLERASTGQLRRIYVSDNYNPNDTTNPYNVVGNVELYKGLNTQSILTQITGYNSSETQTLNHVSGTLQWAATFPSQSGNSGKFLTTNGTAVSWATVDALPTQSGQSGKYLTTDGSSASWATISSDLPSQSGQSGKYLTTNGTTASWANVPTEIPSQSGNTGKFLTTNGSAVSWATIPPTSTITYWEDD